MSTALGLAMQISANTAQLGTAVQDINKRLDQMGDSGKKAANDLGVLKNLEIAKAFIAGITAVATGLVRAASGAKDLFDSSRAAIDEIGKLSARTGIAVETIQQLQLVATESGSSTDALAKAFGRLGAEIGKGAVEGGADKVNKKFELLGLTYEQLSKQTPEEQFYAVADAVASIEDPAQRLAAVTEVFGARAGMELVNAFQMGGDKLREVADEAADLGATLSQGAVSAVEQMNDQIGRVGFAFQNVLNQVTAYLAPVVTTFAEKIQDIIKGLGVDNIGEFLAKALLTFADNFLAGLAFIVDTILVVADSIRQAIDLIPGVDLQTEDERFANDVRGRREIEKILESDGLSVSRRRALEQTLAGRGGPLTEEDRRRFDALEQSGGGGLREGAQGFFDAAREGVRQGFALLDAQPEADVTTQVTEGTESGNAAVVEAVNRNTEEQRRNATQVVEIPR
jgi:hypothetical protein